MKKIYFFLVAILFAFNAQSQVVVLSENFDGPEDPLINWGLFPFGDDTTWISFDFDGLNTYDNDDTRKQWYWSDFFHQYDDADTLFSGCIASLSYMENFAEGNRNYLILPPVDIANPSYTLHWKSAPFQGPRYMDGYSVLVSTTTNDALSNVFVDTIYRAASMKKITGEGESVKIENFEFTPGYIHANNLTDSTYCRLWAPGDSTLMRGFREPHSQSLSSYLGERIYIAFLHDSDDDYFLALDDIMIVADSTNTFVGTGALSADQVHFTTYPNPVENFLNILFSLPVPEGVSLRISDASGKVIATPIAAGMKSAGQYNLDFDMRALPSGAYAVSLSIGSQTFTKMVVRK